jgi:general secretion pathway protein D
MAMLVLAIALGQGHAQAQNDANESVDANLDPLSPQLQNSRQVGTVQGIPVFSEPAARRPARPKTEVVPGDGQFLQPNAVRRKTSNSNGSISLDFADAELKDVVRTVLGDILKLPFTVDPAVTGKITLKSVRPLSENGVVATLETALRANNAAIVKADGVYNVIPMTEAQKRVESVSQARMGSAHLPGFGIEAVPLRFVAAGEIQKILGGLVPQGAVTGIDVSRNLMFIQGTAPERAAALATIEMFDVDYLKAMSFAFVKPQHTDPNNLAAELKSVIDRPNSPSSGLVQFIPLDRTGTLIIVSGSERHLRSAVQWAEKLDTPPTGPSRQVYYYRLQSAKIQDIAPTLAAIWGGTQGAAPALAQSDANASVIAPVGQAQNAGSPSREGAQSAMSRDSAQGAAASATSAASGPQIIPDEANNAVIIRANKGEYDAIVRFLKEIDVTPAQVLIEATIAEVSLNDTLRFGVEWYFRSGDSTFNFSRSGRVSSQFPGFSYTYLVPDVEVALNALGTVTTVNVISSPKLLTLDNRAATLQVGDQVPVITQSAVAIGEVARPTVVNSVQFRDTGIVLRVTPRVGKGGTVYIEINQEVSDAVPTTTSGIDSPTIQQRKIATSVAVQDGETMALGGLIRRSQSGGDSGVPVLKDVPLLGSLFKTESESSGRTELLIFIRPRIVNDAATARAVTEELKMGLGSLEALIGGQAPGAR